MSEWVVRALPMLVLCLVVGACGSSGGPVATPGSGYDPYRFASAPGQEYWDNLAAYKGRPRYDYPGPALNGATGGAN